MKALEKNPEKRYQSAGEMLAAIEAFEEQEQEAREATFVVSASLPDRPKVSGVYISSALAGGTTKTPGVVARATYS